MLEKLEGRGGQEAVGIGGWSSVAFPVVVGANAAGAGTVRGTSTAFGC